MYLYSCTAIISFNLINLIYNILFFCCIVSIILLSKSSKSKYNLSIKHIYTSVTNTESLARFETCEVQTAAWQFTKPHTGHTDDTDDSTCTIHARQHKTTQNHTTHGTARLHRLNSIKFDARQKHATIGPIPHLPLFQLKKSKESNARRRARCKGISLAKSFRDFYLHCENETQLTLTSLTSRTVAAVPTLGTLQWAQAALQILQVKGPKDFPNWNDRSCRTVAPITPFNDATLVVTHCVDIPYGLSFHLSTAANPPHAQPW